MNLKKVDSHLKKDKVMAKIIKDVGDVLAKVKKKEWEWGRERDHFESLVMAIVFQQLSSKAADTIHGRFKKKVGKMTPENVLKLKDEEFRACGVSRQKRGYLRDLSKKFHKLLDNADNMSNEEVMDSLIQVKGIGRWTAEMFLMFTLYREDLFPVDDLAIQRAVVREYGLKYAGKEEMEKLAEQWRPYRTIASLYLWKSNSKD